MNKLIKISLIIILLLAAIIPESCKNKNTAPNPIQIAQFSKYIAAYTSGLISKNASIKVQLLNSVVKGIKDKKKLSEDIFEFEPSIKGTVEWADNNTIEFIPQKALPQGKEFKVSFKLEELIEIKNKDLKEFNFGFRTIEQSLQLQINEQKTIDKQKLKWQRIIGTIKTADEEEVGKLKKVFKVKQGGKKLNIKIKEISDNEFNFVIDSVERSESASEVQIEWNGEAIEANIEGEKKIEIPSISEFKFMSARIVQQPEQYLQLQFSDPLKANQNLSGMVRIGNLSNMNYIIEGNLLKIYPETRLSGVYNLKIFGGIKNILDYKIINPLEEKISFEEMKPAIKVVNKGVILPNSKKGLVFPFEAVNLKAVDVQIVKIYENNIEQFLQVNDLSGNYQLKRVGKPIVQKTIDLTKSKVVDFNRWNRFYLELDKLIETEPGAIYNITLGFRQKHSLFNCENSTEADNTSTLEEQWNESEEEASYWDSFNEYNYSYYDWEQRNNPCNKAYYGKRRNVTQNIFASNFGIIAKKGEDKKLMVFVTDLLTTQAEGDVKVEVYDYQNQLISSSVTDGSGIATFENMEDEHLIVVKKDAQRGYLKIKDGLSLSLSRFDIGGNKISKGLKGFIYGERGVWRPGDTIYLTFILEETAETLPHDLPIVMELRNPMGQLKKREVQSYNPTGFYSYKIKTAEEDITGNWRANIHIGGAKFHKTLKVETVKPNRLKIKVDFGSNILIAGDKIKGKMNVKWLHGAVAKNLKTKVEATFVQTNTTFKKYSDFEFDDPTKNFYSENITIFNDAVDENGNAYFSAETNKIRSAPGMLKASFTTKVFEKGGDFSIDQYSIPFAPYKSFVGIKLPKGDKARGMLLTDTTHRVEIITLSPEGKKINENHKIELEFYKIKWKWWWDKSTNDLISYATRQSMRSIKKTKISTIGGKASWNIRINYPEWGRYLVRATDLETGHSTAKVVYIDWPGWAGRAQKTHGEGAAMLAVSTDKEKYNTGEEVTVTIPSGAEGRALVSIETGSKILETHWVETEKGETLFKFKTTKEMSPNVYVNVTLLQAHAQTANDLPIRMYGIVPIKVEEQTTHLMPEIEMPEVLKSEEEFTLTVSEKNNREMTYTLAVVDEGLLDLTRFKTPDPWNYFYAKEALGVKTWDLYDRVIGAYGGQLERLLSIGGGYGGAENAKNQKAQRFKPVVKFLGPFNLKKGKNKHKIKMPRYIGSVRTMIIAGNKGAYGSVSKTTPVKKPLMLLATLPRVLGPGEKVKLPVTLFAMDKKIKDVTVKVKTNPLLKIEGSSVRKVHFTKEEEKDISFNLDVASKLGIAEVEVIAISGGEKSICKIELDVRNPNSNLTKVISAVVQGGDSWQQQYVPLGIRGTNKAVIEISTIPALNLEKRLDYLISYPHGCIEQITSGAFPQLYLSDLIKLDKGKKERIEENVKTAINKIGLFQVANGGMGYWQNSRDVSLWATNYTGHFLLEARKKGYSVSDNMMKKWRKYQRQKARNWTNDGENSQLIQAYRLFTLALAKKSEIGAMNRLKQISNLSEKAKWRLAAAYFIAGKKRVAEKMLEKINHEFYDYTENSVTFGSGLRDKAMILETMSMMKDKTKAYLLLKEVASELGSERWYSTQTTAYSLIAISRYVNKNKLSNKINCSYNVGNGDKKISSNKIVEQITIPVSGLSEKSLHIKNQNSGVLFVSLISQGIPQVGEEEEYNNNMSMKVNYSLSDGTAINPSKIEQGTDFVAEVIITNPTNKRFNNIALTQIFPSGWEIINSRMFGQLYGNFSRPTYQDIRDDRVYTYFDLAAKQTKKFIIRLNASYAGKFYLPGAKAELMYNATINATKAGKWVEVQKTEFN